MEPNPAIPHEVEGVLNPALTRGSDGHLYLFPRMVAAGNYSRIGLARVCLDRRGNPHGVERLGVALEPAAPYELNGQTGGGVEDPRVTFVAACRLYVMTYTALGEAGPRIALAVSRDLRRWRRLGLAGFTPYRDVDMAALDNKDALLFPEPVRGPDGRLALALLHRPTFGVRPLWLREGRPSIWISYAPFGLLAADAPLVFSHHRLLAGPVQDWERLKIGGGTPPVRTPAGWLLLYHGVSGDLIDSGVPPRALTYRAGAMLLDGRDPRQVVYRSAQSILEPLVAAERMGAVPRVVFPTGLDVRADGALDVYYGMADSRIGVARATLTELLQPAVAQAA
jgi:predicted GH43/DUF377 family glycosyl hydrolase